MRSYKKVGSVESTYQYLGDKLVYEKRGDIELQYGYNSFGDLTLLRYTEADGTINYYYAVCNSRGDVEDIYNGAGELRAHYTYDSWGNVISITDQNGKEITSSTHIGILNPIRYRGYYYDAETGYYYLQSRYYNPQVGRFLNEDNLVAGVGSVFGYNMFAYCGNDPANMIDAGGDCYYNAQGVWCHDNWELIPNKEGISFLSTKAKAGDSFKLRKDKRKGSDNRQKSGSRERNVGHKNGEEHSRVPKGNRAGVSRMEPIVVIGVLTITSVAIVVIVTNDTTGIGVIDDLLLLPVMKLWWDAACAL